MQCYDRSHLHANNRKKTPTLHPEITHMIQYHLHAHNQASHPQCKGTNPPSPIPVWHAANYLFLTAR